MAIDVDYETALCARVQHENLVLECAHVPNLFTQFILYDGSDSTCCDVVETDKALSKTKEELKAIVLPILDRQIRLMNENNRHRLMLELLSFFKIPF